MPADSTSRLALPLLDPGQAQKEMSHNEALARLDLLVQPVVVAVGTDDPPATPAPGQCWIVGDAPTGAWAGNAGALAGWTDGGWRFVAPSKGMAVAIGGTGVSARFAAGGWRVGELVGSAVLIAGQQVVGPRAAAIPLPSGGTTVDGEARAAIDALIAALVNHGLISG